MHLLEILAIYVVGVWGMSWLFSVPWYWIAIPLGILFLWMYFDEGTSVKTTSKEASKKPVSKNNQGNSSTKTQPTKKPELVKPVTTAKTVVLDETFKSDTKFLLDTGIKIVSNASDGGSIVCFFEGNGSQMRIHLYETTLLRYLKECTSYGYKSKSEFMSGWCKITENEAEQILEMTRIYVHRSDNCDDWVSFDYYYPRTVSKYDLKNWVEDYLRTNYSNYKLEIKGNTLSLVGL